ncbi:MAG: hypothetical protein ACXU8N_10895 [Telluria sp.]
MLEEIVPVFLVLFACHLGWRAGQNLVALPRYDRPWFFTQFGILGDLLIVGLVPSAIILALATVVWGQIHLAWYLPVPLFILAGLTFSFLHSVLVRSFGLAYLGLFPALGAIVGWIAMLCSISFLWLR